MDPFVVMVVWACLLRFGWWLFFGKDRWNHDRF